MQQALEAAARQHGRSLHGEILHRLEHSLQSVGLAPPVATVAASASQVRTADGVIQLSEADWAHITEQVALRLQARR